MAYKPKSFTSDYAAQQADLVVRDGKIVKNRLGRSDGTIPDGNYKLVPEKVEPFWDLPLRRSGEYTLEEELMFHSRHLVALYTSAMELFREIGSARTALDGIIINHRRQNVCSLPWYMRLWRKFQFRGAL